MFSARNLVFLALSVVLAGQAIAVPMPMPMMVARQSAVEHREAAPFDTIPAYVKRSSVNTIPAEQATMAPDGVIVPYTATKGKRDINTVPEELPSKSNGDGNIVPYKRAQLNTIPAEQATMAPDGVIVPYTATKGKRDINTLPEELPSKSDGNGKIIPYKRADVNTIPAEQATMAPDGVIVPYTATKGRRDINTVPEELPSKSNGDGKIVPYKRAQLNTIPAEQATMAPDGVIVPYTATKGKRDINTVPEELPSKSNGDGNIVPYKRAQLNTIPAEQATMAPDGIIVPYTATGGKN